jgi:hypothetical protein
MPAIHTPTQVYTNGTCLNKKYNALKYGSTKIFTRDSQVKRIAAGLLTHSSNGAFPSSMTVAKITIGTSGNYSYGYSP